MFVKSRIALGYRKFPDNEKAPKGKNL